MAAVNRLSTVHRHLSSSSKSKQVERMTVFGAGLMGAGIAQVGAQNGMKVCTSHIDLWSLPRPVGILLTVL